MYYNKNIKTCILSFFSIIFLISIVAFASAEEDFKYDPNGKRDPFVPLVSEGGGYASDAYAVNAIEDVRLEGVVWDELKGSIAIVNGEIVKEGQEIGSVKILKIEKDGVIFYVGGENVKVELNAE